MATDIKKITLTTKGKIAIITLNNPSKLNALNPPLWHRLSSLMRQVAARPDIYITILTGKGRYFSAGADVSTATTASSPKSTPGISIEIDEETRRRESLYTFVPQNLDLTHVFATHPKILISALNGPCVGLSACLIAFSDFIYATPDTFLLTPFTGLGLVAEGGASRAFVQRMGIGLANEALIMSKRISVEELVQVNFVNKIISPQPKPKGEEDDGFLEQVLKEVEERLGDHLSSESLLQVKALIRRPERDIIEAQNVAEVLAGLERLASGVPQEELRKLTSGEKRHKL